MVKVIDLTAAIENDYIRFGVERSRMLARALRCHPAVLLFPGWDTGVEAAAQLSRQSSRRSRVSCQLEVGQIAGSRKGGVTGGGCFAAWVGVRWIRQT